MKRIEPFSAAIATLKAEGVWDRVTELQAGSVRVVLAPITAAPGKPHELTEAEKLADEMRRPPTTREGLLRRLHLMDEARPKIVAGKAK